MMMDEEQSNSVAAGAVVSVVVITYNHAPYIGEALDSILAQKTNFPIEICIGEDESNDGTRGICLDYARRYPKQIRLFLRSREDVMYFRGRPCGRNNFVKTLASCRGKYVALLEGDDYWTDTLKLQKQFDALEANPNAVCCHHGQRLSFEIEGREKEIQMSSIGDPIETFGDVRDIFSGRREVHTRTAMYRNIEIISNLPGWFYQVFAGDFSLAMIAGRFGEFIFIDEPMAVYRITGNGYSRTGKKFTREENLERNLLWVDLWDYGIRYNTYIYVKEARSTVLEFYREVIKPTGLLDFGILLCLLKHRKLAVTSSLMYDGWLFAMLPLVFVEERLRQVRKGISRRLKKATNYTNV